MRHLILFVAFCCITAGNTIPTTTAMTTTTATTTTADGSMKRKTKTSEETASGTRIGLYIGVAVAGVLVLVALVILVNMQKRRKAKATARRQTFVNQVFEGGEYSNLSALPTSPRPCSASGDVHVLSAVPSVAESDGGDMRRGSRVSSNALDEPAHEFLSKTLSVESDHTAHGKPQATVRQETCSAPTVR